MEAQISGGMPVARVTNLNRTMEELKAAGLWFTGADMDGAVEYHRADLRGPMGLVIGGEGGGHERILEMVFVMRGLDPRIHHS